MQNAVPIVKLSVQLLFLNLLYHRSLDWYYVNTSFCELWIKKGTSITEFQQKIAFNFVYSLFCIFMYMYRFLK